MSYSGHIKNGVVVFNDSAELPEGAEVRVEIVSKENPVPSGSPEGSLYEALKPFIGAFKGLPADASVNHDHYLYGTQKRQ